MYEEVINFWFSEIEPKQWWKKDEQFDLAIQTRFSGLHRRAGAGELFEWRGTALGSLAEVIVLDQFSRNMFRGKPESFAYDAMALTLSQFAVSNGFDQQLSAEQRIFLYMPFMHSESKKIHVEAVRLFESLGIQSNLDFEHRHKDIIDRFGRYPHRNDILGRKSSQEEIDFLRQPGSGF